MAFLVIGAGEDAIEIPVPEAGGMDAAPDGMGKWRYMVTVANVEPTVYAALVTLIGTPSGAESDRAWDGTLLTDLPLVAVSGDAMTDAGVTVCEARITAAPYRPRIQSSASGYSRRFTLVLREA